MSTIKHVFDDLSAYLDQELSAGDARRVEAHLRTCAQCRRELESLRYTMQMVQALPSLRAPRSFTLSDAQAARVRPQSSGGWLVNALRGMTVIATVLLIAVCGIDFMNLSNLQNGRASAPAPSVLSLPNQSTAQDNASPATETSKTAPTNAAGPSSAQPVLPPTAPGSPAGAGAQQPLPTSSAVLAFSTAATPANTASAPVPPALPQGTATADPTPLRPSVASAASATPDTTTAGSARSSVVPTATVTGAPATRPAPTVTATPLPPTTTPKPTVAPTITATPIPAAAQAQPPAPAEPTAGLLPPQRIIELVLVGIIALGGIALFSLRIFGH
jgi:anti-sigma factor RsiW